MDQFTLISGAPYSCGGFLVYPPRLDDIRGIGYEQYQMFLSIFLMTKEDVLQMLEIDPSAAGEVEFDILQLITMIPQLRDALLRALSFFMHVSVTYDEEIGYLIEETGDGIPLRTIWTIRRAILKFCYVNDESDIEPPTFKNEKAREIWEKIQKHKAAARKQKRSGHGDGSMDLPNLIGAVCAYSSTYSLLNVWDLTVYQFYDQFARLDNRIQVDVYGQRWAAWGKDDFDFSIWRKALNQS